MVAEVARSKALAVALRKVEVKVVAGTVVDLSEFIGTDEEDAIEALAATRDDESDIIFDDEQPASSEPTL